MKLVFVPNNPRSITGGDLQPLVDELKAEDSNIEAEFVGRSQVGNTDQATAESAKAAPATNAAKLRIAAAIADACHRSPTFIWFFKSRSYLGG